MLWERTAFQTFITSGHCVVELPIANYRFGIFKHVLLVDIVLLIYPILITPLVSFKHLIVAIVLSIYQLLINPLVSSNMYY